MPIRGYALKLPDYYQMFHSNLLLGAIKSKYMKGISLTKMFSSTLCLIFLPAEEPQTFIVTHPSGH